MAVNDHLHHAHGVNGNTDPPVKKRAACDECRLKKLKCTGEHPSCSRCKRERISCIYSPQKQMGRPKKRQKVDELAAAVNAANGTAHQTSNTAHASTTSLSRLLDEPMQWDITQPSHDEAPELSAYQTAFTPNGSLQPWLHQTPIEWPEYSADEDPNSSSESRIPSLVADSPTHSSPSSNNNQSSDTSNTTDDGHNDSATDLFESSLNGLTLTNADLGLPSGLMPNCACLSTLYLTLNTLSTMDPAFTFPFALHPLREAMSTAATVLECEECPTRCISAIHNTQLTGTLLISIAERFQKILEHITREAERAARAGETKRFRLADLNTATSHLHLGGPSCAAAFNLELSPAEWRMLAKKVVRAEVHGPPEGNDCCSYFLGIAQQMADRQDKWHRRPVPEDFPKEMISSRPKEMKKEDHLCLKLVSFSKKMVEGYDWS